MTWKLTTPQLRRVADKTQASQGLGLLHPFLVGFGAKV